MIPLTFYEYSELLLHFNLYFAVYKWINGNQNQYESEKEWKKNWIENILIMI